MSIPTDALALRCGTGLFLIPNYRCRRIANEYRVTPYFTLVNTGL